MVIKKKISNKLRIATILASSLTNSFKYHSIVHLFKRVKCLGKDIYFRDNSSKKAFNLSCTGA